MGAISQKIEHFTGLKLCKSSFSFQQGQEYDTSFSETAGYFVPRELKGYINPDTSKPETIRRISHEVSHGLYLENTPTGRLIVSCDRKIADAETTVFGRLVRKGERLLVLTDREISGTYQISQLDKATRLLVPQDIDTSGYSTVAFVNEEGFRDYMTLRAAYTSLVSGDIENQEGFCTVMEHKVSQETAPGFADELFWQNVRSSNVYGRGFRKLKTIESRYGLYGMIDYLMGGVGNAGIGKIQEN